MTTKYDTYLTSSMEKVAPDWQPTTNVVPLCLLKKDTTAFQIAMKLEHWTFEWAHINITSSIPATVTVKQVKLSPASWPKPGMYPDLLSKLDESDQSTFGKIKLVPRQFRALWIEIETNEASIGGSYPILITGKNDAGEEIFSKVATVDIIPVTLPKQDIYHTEWFHADCLADYYQVDVFSERHWEIIENFVNCGVKRGINTLLTPIFTYPLDTAEGGSRTTIQLVKMAYVDGMYQFDFEQLERWVKMCQKCGIEYFEMAHFYSQWGAKYAPKIVVEVNGEDQELFGWHTPGVDESYQTFLRAFLPALDKELIRLGVNDHTFFHISDEPSMEHLAQYTKAREIVEELLPKYPIIDALTDFEFYQTGVCTRPIPSNNHITPFLEANVPNLWTYYCTAQRGPESNRFFHLPSAQTRIIGAQIYKYNLAGFLHWGFNFYNSHHSLKHINPYETTDADQVFDAGDPFLVYPGADGYPEESYRLLMMDAAFKDIRAMKLLAEYIGDDQVKALIDHHLDVPTMTSYPRSTEPLLTLRHEINRKIAEVTQ